MNFYNIIYRYKYFIYQSIKNDLKNRFNRSKLGSLWIILNPLSQVLIYTLILSNVLSAKLLDVNLKYAYAVYLMAGLLGWNLFSEIISRSVNIFIDYGNLIKKMNFPKILLPITLVGSCLVNNLILLLVMMVVFLILGYFVSLSIFWLVPLILITALFAMSIGLIVGIINVFSRDLRQVIPIILQLVFWFTPIVYPLSIIPERYRYLLSFNPIYALTDGYQKIILYANPPDFELLCTPIFLTLIFFCIAFYIFPRASDDMADVL